MFFAIPYNRATVAEGGMAVLGEAQVTALPDLGPSRHLSVWPGEETLEVTEARSSPEGHDWPDNRAAWGN